jgi:hypothetical protein
MITDSTMIVKVENLKIVSYYQSIIASIEQLNLSKQVNMPVVSKTITELVNSKDRLS